MNRLFNRRDLIRLIVPLIVDLLLTLLVGMIDSVMVSSAGESAVSGVSLIDTVFQLIIYIFAAFGTGGAVVAGQYLGADETKNARKTTDQLLWFSGLCSLVIMAVVYGIRGVLLGHVFGSITEEVYWNANRYLLVVALSIPAISVYESGAAIFRTMGNAKVTMYLSALMNLINICGNAVLIYGAGWGTVGAATATVIARYVAAGWMITLLLRQNQSLFLTRSLHFTPDRALIRRILQIGIPNGVENGLFQVGKIILASLIASFGTSAIAANAICLTIAGIQVIPGSAISMAAIAVIARCVGAGDEKQVCYYNRLLISVSYLVLVIFCGAFWLAMPKILSWYNLTAETARLTRQMVLVHTLGAMIIWPLTFVLPSSLRAAGDVGFAMIASVISMFVFRLGAAYLFAQYFGAGALGIWLAMLCDWGFRAIVFCLRWLSGAWKKKHIL
ncbi:MAG: MATE family efflux transporter [Eubacteriales bacterium]|nr:MATE family efflux transporter [Eubacteriales bacterium]